MSQTILCFQLSKEKEKAVEQICRKLRIRIQQVAVRDYGQKLGYLARIQGFTREASVYTKGEFAAEMLVFSGMDSEQLDAFLDAYKQTTLSPVERKAVMTQHNIFWTAEQLYQELSKEYLQFSGKNS